MTTKDQPDAIRVRFAPAPTGYLHLGGARTALFNWLFARGRGGVFVLRIEDTDTERSTDASTNQVLDALRWLGLNWDEGPRVGGPYEPYFQSQRREIHLEHARKLKAEGKAYDCYMSQEELETRRKVAIAESRPFRYEGWHRDLTSEQVEKFKAEGRKPALRLRVDPAAEGYTVEDMIKGPTHFPPEQMDDFVLVRSDGTPSFHLANVVDDATMRITHVIRGEDHLTNTIRHQTLFSMLGYPAPRYGHVPMILGPDRSKLSKRHGAVSVMDYAAQGYLPDAMINELALLGWSSEDGKEELTREELIARFGLERCGKSGSIFDFDKLDHFNRIRIKAMPVAELEKLIAPHADGIFAQVASPHDLIELVRDEIVKLTDFPGLARRILSEPEYSPEALNDEGMKQAKAVAEKIAAMFEAVPEPMTRDAVKAMLKDAGKTLGIKGKELFMPVRVALTGQTHGPSLDGTIAVLGRSTCAARLKKFAERIA